MKWFTGCATVAAIKQLYRTLAMKHHPDRGGDNATMQDINEQYHQILQSMHETATKDEEGETHRYYYSYTREQSLMDQIARIIEAGLLDNHVELWIVGSWLWLWGDTKPIKDQLTELGMRWHGLRQRWYWKPAGRRSAYNQSASFGDLMATYGASYVEDDKQSHNEAGSTKHQHAKQPAPALS